MKYIIITLALLYTTGCTTATNYTQAEKDANEGHAPKMFLGVLKVYPQAALKIATTPMILVPTCSPHISSTTYIYNTTTIQHSNGTHTAYTTKGTIR